ncbi:DUF4384 domain-containing protein [Pyxidicoccus sp. MSG2]|uniref:DUF4384 domain-containing protein n=1 Tax=Pyxidicoccus sp. MSG2 TaxID=2996790 RepID=UPI002271140C|nr:DUF4384 domain-containing protein [Pyxidicoccus sp. MSG2]MCY1019707.1 DUF4384 domain-containing protein [Pyxidicoccus sp. MSG2]
MSAGERRIQDALLERYLADALAPEARRQLESVLAESAPDRERLEALRADSAAFLVQHPPGPLVARYEAAEPARRRPWWVLLVPALAASVLVVVWLREDPYTVKGTVSLVLHRKAGDGSTRVEPGATLAPGDVLQFEVKAAEDGYVAVLSRDGQGTVTVYHPFGGTEAARYQAARPMLPAAIELDGVRGHEEVYALHSSQPFALDQAVAALKEGRKLEDAAPKGVAVEHVGFDKR